MIKRGKEQKADSEKFFKNRVLTVSSFVFLVLILAILIVKNFPNANAVEGQCIPNWKCTEFTPEKCLEGNRIRTCIDLNECGTDETKPTLTEDCKSKSAMFFILVGILEIAIISLIVIILKRLLKKREKYRERPKAQGKHYKNDENFPSEIEQYYSSDQTHNYKAPKKNIHSNGEKQEKFPDKYWPK